MHTYVVDTSAIVTRFHQKDTKHKEVVAWFESLVGEDILLTPALALTEISAAFKQCGISRSKRDRVLTLIEDAFDVSNFLINDAKNAGEIAFETGCRGCDSVFIALAKANRAILVTKDARQADSAQMVGIEVKRF